MIFVQILVAFAAAVVLFYSISCINRMTPKTHHGIRASFVLIAAGGFGELCAILQGHQPGIAETLFMLGAGLLNFLDRRAGIRCPLLDEKGLPKC